jgi:NAD+ synthase (glutamine-hydrolysing)
VLGIRDYFSKSKAKKLILGLSGGIDSSLAACLATEALGKENVVGVTLTSKITSQDSIDDATELAKNLGIQLRRHFISDLVDDTIKELKLSPSKLTLENLQVRARALLLMTLSNEEGSLLISTANKAEIAMGYGTLYGDLSGALMPLGDLFKCEVYGLAFYLNHLDRIQSKTERIPIRSLLREPTAELSPGQKDIDSLPVYEKLDSFLEDYIHSSGNVRGKVENWDNFLGPGHSVASLCEKIHSQEFKRRQSAPVLRVHNRAFGAGWRMPLAKGFKS